MSIIEQLRRAVDRSGEDFQDIAAAIGCSPAQMGRFMGYKSAFSQQRLEALARYLRLTLVEDTET